ncbi:uncharacterized protein SOCE26_058140 [Sorangium cellulosum]|uniref:DUF3540 domain-containing protein n=1 Tax=Sorangium cellulosum TaxID=56 RepID=A0A2L0EYI9_SORCE|nr:DUF3540 domain-containing protein [Sorangium cellulosum]AUX44350.1 uncharacterized protein SOCE26_058140 [Sorangium cellulosum]
MASKGVSTARVDRDAEAPPAEVATVVALGEAGRAEVRVSDGSGRTEAVPARVAQIAGYRPSPGDRVLVTRDREAWYVIAVLHAASPPGLALPDGATAEVRGEALEVRDPAGRLVIRYAGGAAEVASPERDLVLSAPNGRVVLRSGMDVAIEARRDVTHRAGRRVELGAGDAAAPAAVRVEPASVHVETPRLTVAARKSRLATGEATIFARSIATTAEHVAENVGRYELQATRLVERTRETLREVEDLLEARIGRARTLVRGVFTLHTRRTAMVSTEETSVDGKRVLLG